MPSGVYVRTVKLQQVECANCGSLFTGTPDQRRHSREGRNVYCPSGCRAAARPPLLVRCAHCASEFIGTEKQRSRWLRGQSVYHTDECRREARRAVVTSRYLECSYCGTPFHACKKQRLNVSGGGRAFCSDECRDEVKLTLEERFLAHVHRLPNGCLECDLKPNNMGYPLMGVDGKHKLISHVAWFLHYGEWPPQPLDHACHIPDVCDGGTGDPHRLCAEWSHLKLTTYKENTSPQRSSNSRLTIARRKAQTHCKRDHEFTEENTYIAPNGQRVCKQCAQIRKQQYRSQKQEAA